MALKLGATANDVSQGLQMLNDAFGRLGDATLRAARASTDFTTAVPEQLEARDPECICGETDDEHECPYRSEVNGDAGMCTCCMACTARCGAEV